MPGVKCFPNRKIVRYSTEIMCRYRNPYLKLFSITCSQLLHPLLMTKPHVINQNCIASPDNKTMIKTPCLNPTCRPALRSANVSYPSSSPGVTHAFRVPHWSLKTLLCSLPSPGCCNSSPYSWDRSGVNSTPDMVWNDLDSVLLVPLKWTASKKYIISFLSLPVTPLHLSLRVRFLVPPRHKNVSAPMTLRMLESLLVIILSLRCLGTSALATILRRRWVLTYMHMHIDAEINLSLVP